MCVCEWDSLSFFLSLSVFCQNWMHHKRHTFFSRRLLLTNLSATLGSNCTTCPSHSCRQWKARAASAETFSNPRTLQRSIPTQVTQTHTTPHHSRLQHVFVCVCVGVGKNCVLCLCCHFVFEQMFTLMPASHPSSHRMNN